MRRNGWMYCGDTGSRTNRVSVVRFGVLGILDDRQRASYTDYKDGRIKSYSPAVPAGYGMMRYYHFDELGSTRMLTDGSGIVIDRYVCDAWGNTLSHTGSTDQPYQYVGRID